MVDVTKNFPHRVEILKQKSNELKQAPFLQRAEKATILLDETLSVLSDMAVRLEAISLDPALSLYWGAKAND